MKSVKSNRLGDTPDQPNCTGPHIMPLDLNAQISYDTLLWWKFHSINCDLDQALQRFLAPYGPKRHDMNRLTLACVDAAAEVKKALWEVAYMLGDGDTSSYEVLAAVEKSASAPRAAAKLTEYRATDAECRKELLQRLSEKASAEVKTLLDMLDVLPGYKNVNL